MITLKQEIINLVAEIKGWNDGDLDIILDPRFVDGCALKKLCVQVRAKTISQLQKLVEQLD
jgi:hypothetical protein